MSAAIAMADRRSVLRLRALRALRALRDCGVIRADRRSPGYLDLWADGLADAVHPAGSRLAVADFRLTAAGRTEAERAL